MLALLSAMSHTLKLTTIRMCSNTGFQLCPSIKYKIYCMQVPYHPNTIYIKKQKVIFSTKAFMYGAVGSFLHYQILRTHISLVAKKRVHSGE